MSDQHYVQNGDTYDFVKVSESVFKDETQWKPHWVNNTIVARKIPGGAWHFDVAFGNVTTDVIQHMLDLVKRIKDSK